MQEGCWRNARVRAGAEDVIEFKHDELRVSIGGIMRSSLKINRMGFGVEVKIAGIEAWLHDRIHFAC